MYEGSNDLYTFVFFEIHQHAAAEWGLFVCLLAFRRHGAPHNICSCESRQQVTNVDKIIVF